MSRLAASFVLGYHGCDADVARRIVNGETGLLLSDRDYDWLGPGAYFWESDPKRALEWAKQAKAQNRIMKPAVIGAVIDLGNCLDLLSRDNLELVRLAHDIFVEEQVAAGLTIPENASLKSEPDKILRRLDCAVIKFLHEVLEDQDAEPFDSVRCLFAEGDPLYPGAGFKDRTHVQIAVRNTEKLLGAFYPPDYGPAERTPLSD